MVPDSQCETYGQVTARYDRHVRVRVLQVTYEFADPVTNCYLGLRSRSMMIGFPGDVHVRPVRPVRLVRHVRKGAGASSPCHIERWHGSMDCMHKYSYNVEMIREKDGGMKVPKNLKDPCALQHPCQPRFSTFSLGSLGALVCIGGISPAFQYIQLPYSNFFQKYISPSLLCHVVPFLQLLSSSFINFII